MNYKRILVFGAHPDDETTMAGTMSMLAARGVEVYVAIMTDGREGYPKPEWKDRIVAMRKEEQAACDKVLGVTRRFNYNAPDQGLCADKPTLVWCIGVIRQVRPDAVFNHGPDDPHNDHRRTCEVVRDALFHAGEPVNGEVGAPHRVPHAYYYKAVKSALPRITLDVTDYCEKGVESRGTQTSQFTLWHKTKADFDAEVSRLRRERPKTHETFWIAEQTRMTDFIPLVGDPS